MWTHLRIEIEKVRNEFSIGNNEFQQVGLNDWKTIEEKIYKTFCQSINHNSKPVWLWEYFKLDSFSIAVEKPSYLYLDKLIEDDEKVWFFISETVRESDKFWFYEGQVKAIQKIIRETGYGHELYLVSKKYEWLICINHHNVLFATGKIMPDKLKGIEVS